MYEKLIQQLAQLLRGNMVPDEFYPVALQLLAWVRVSKRGHLTGALAFNPAEPPRDAKQLISVFSQIGSSKALGPDSNAFAYVSPALQHLSPGQVLQTLELLAIANLDERWAAHNLTATMSNGAGKWFASLPDEVTKLMATLARIEPLKKVYLPFEQIFQLTAAVQEKGAATFSETKMAWAFPWLINLLSDTSASVYVGDSLERPGFLDDGRLAKFDISLSFPPFGVKCDPMLTERDLFERFPEQTASIAVLAVRHILARTKGRAVVAVPNGLLFSPGAERSLREDLLAKHLIEAVIGLPAALLPNTALTFSLLVLNCERTSDRIVFVDGTRETLSRKDGKGRAVLTGWERIAGPVLSGCDETFSCVVPVTDVLKNDAQLQVTRYCRTPEAEAVESLLAKYPYRELADIVTVVRPSPASSEEGAVPAMEVGPGDFPEFGYAHVPGREIRIAEVALSKGHKQLLRPFDIAIAIKGSVGKVAIIPPDLHGGETVRWVAGQSCLVLRANDKCVIDPRVLFSFLKSEVGQAQLKQIVSGASVPLIQLRELEKIKIPIPDLLEQQKTIEVFERIVEIERLVVKSRDEQRQLSNAIWTI
jgi:type I restriction enzyme M protein